jgi:hypothetical protein
VTRAYSNFHLPPLDPGLTGSSDHYVTLVQQSGGLRSLSPAVDQEPATGPWQSTVPRMSEAVELFEAGHSLTQISLKLGIAWDSVARLLDRAGVRERKNKSR